MIDEGACSVVMARAWQDLIGSEVMELEEEYDRTIQFDPLKKNFS